MNLAIVRSNAPEFQSLWHTLRLNSSSFSAFYTPLDLEYQANYPQPWQPTDRSFLVCDSEGPIAGAMISMRDLGNEARELSGYGRPIFYIENVHSTLDRLSLARKKVTDFLKEVFSKVPVATAIHRCWGPCLDPIARFLMDEGGKAVPYLLQVIDLTQDEATLHQQVRPNFRQNVKRGFEELEISVIDASNLRRELFEEFRLLHLKAAGRETRSRATWNVNYRIVEAGEAFLVYGRLNNQLVSAAFFDLVYGYACYRIGAYDRTLFDRPLSHSIIWTGILEAKRRGGRLFEVGQILHETEPFFIGSVPLHGDDPIRTPTEKELGLSHFRRGFGGQTYIGLDIWLRRSSSRVGS